MKQISWFFFLCAIMLMGTSTISLAQTCSCASAPLISSQSISSAAKGNLLVGITYQHNEISNLYSGNDKLNNQTTERHTQSTLLEINYGITSRLTVSGTLTYVQKNRKTGLQTAGNEQSLTTRGIGDGLFMIKYVLHQNTIKKQYQLAAGGGVKIPFGKNTLTQDGLPLNADMQPGSGAWDGVFWSYYSKTFAPQSMINLFGYTTFRLTSGDDRFGPNDRYRYGNEFITSLGVTDNVFDKLSYILMVRYRSTSQDKRNSNPLPNTGGKWINLRPSLGYKISNQISVRVSGQLPVYQYLNGTQPTTTFTLSGSVFYNFGNKTIF